jgi:hypothetical protein
MILMIPHLKKLITGVFSIAGLRNYSGVHASLASYRGLTDV